MYPTVACGLGSAIKSSPTRDAFYEKMQANQTESSMQWVHRRMDEMQTENARVIEFLFSEIDALKAEIATLKEGSK